MNEWIAIGTLCVIWTIYRGWLNHDDRHRVEPFTLKGTEKVGGAIICNDGDVIHMGDAECKPIFTMNTLGVSYFDEGEG